MTVEGGLLCSPCVPRRQLATDVIYSVSSTFDNNTNRFSDPSLDSPYGWVAANGGVEAYVYIKFSQATYVSGIYHAGATVGLIGATKFTVKYSKSTVLDKTTFFYSAFSNATNSHIFVSSGSNCRIEYSVFKSVYHATAVQITPLEWSSSENDAVDAPGMRVATELCEEN
jgi:hypothetical protein